MFSIDGKEVSAETFLAAFPEHKIQTGTPYAPAPVPAAHGDWNKPVTSFGMACAPSKIKDFENFAAAAGVPTDFTTNRGRPIVTSAEHKRKLAKLLRVHDNGNSAERNYDMRPVAVAERRAHEQREARREIADLHALPAKMIQAAEAE